MKTLLIYLDARIKRFGFKFVADCTLAYVRANLIDLIQQCHFWVK